jgi:hypothetical protein
VIIGTRRRVDHPLGCDGEGVLIVGIDRDLVHVSAACCGSASVAKRFEVRVSGTDPTRSHVTSRQKFG